MKRAEVDLKKLQRRAAIAGQIKCIFIFYLAVFQQILVTLHTSLCSVAYTTEMLNVCI